MAQFKAYSENVEVKGAAVLAVINAMPTGKEFREGILNKHGISAVDANKWYKQQSWLDGFKEIYESVGDRTLFTIGKAIPDNADFPPEIDSLEKALASIDMAYHMNHSGGEIGHYTLVDFDLSAKRAIMECNNPYPSEFDRGIITSMLRKFKPATSFKYDVVLDENKDSRLKGGEVDTFIITW